MSDLISGIGSRGAYGLGGPRSLSGSGAASGAASGAEGMADASANLSSGSVEGFAPTSEAGESAQDAQAGQARASEIFAAWGAGSTPAASAGLLTVQGAENTAVNQVHGVQNGSHVGSQGPDAGFSGATVYSSKPPVA